LLAPAVLVAMGLQPGQTFFSPPSRTGNAPQTPDRASGEQKGSSPVEELAAEVQESAAEAEVQEVATEAQAEVASVTGPALGAYPLKHATPNISAHKAQGELDVLLAHLGVTPEWKIERHPEEASFQARVTTLQNRTFASSWQDSEDEAKTEVAQAILQNRLGGHLGDARQTLEGLVKASTSGKLLSIEMDEPEDQRPHARLRLPDEVFGSVEPPEGLVFEGQGENNVVAIQSAAFQALLYICAYIGFLPVLLALGKRSRGTGSGSRFLDFSHFSPETSKDDIRGIFEQFGKLEAFELTEDDSKEGQLVGTATYENSVCAWTAARMLDRSTLDDSIIFAGQRAEKKEVKTSGKKSKVTKTSLKKKKEKKKTDTSFPNLSKFSKASSDELFFRNAPLSESKADLLTLFQQAGNISHIRLLKDPMNGEPVGSGYVRFGSDEIAQKALKQFADMDLKGQKLDVTFCKKSTKSKASKAI